MYFSKQRSRKRKEWKCQDNVIKKVISRENPFARTGILSLSVWIWFTVLCKIPSNVWFSLNGYFGGGWLVISLAVTLKSITFHLSLNWPKMQVNFITHVVSKPVSFSTWIYNHKIQEFYSSAELNAEFFQKIIYISQKMFKSLFIPQSLLILKVYFAICLT